MRILRSNEHKTYEWKNGAGSTTQLLIHPPNASLDTFDYRINTARVTADEPFSRLPGVDRTMFILEGGGLRLTRDGKQVDVTRSSPPFRFTGDTETEARLIDGPTVDFNIMTRSRYKHEAARVKVAPRAELDVTGSPAVLLCYEGSVVLNMGENTATLGQMDVAVVDNASAGRWVLTADEPTTVYLICLSRGPD
jgi:uncharacterized protein